MSDSSVTPWTLAHEDPLFMGFSRQSGLPFPSPGDLPDPGTETVSPAWQVDFFFFFLTTEPQGSPHSFLRLNKFHCMDRPHTGQTRCFGEKHGFWINPAGADPARRPEEDGGLKSRGAGARWLGGEGRGVDCSKKSNC